MIPDSDNSYQLFGRRLLAGCNSTQRTYDFSWIAARWANPDFLKLCHLERSPWDPGLQGEPKNLLLLI
jgi:hypothetical protein